MTDRLREARELLHREGHRLVTTGKFTYASDGRGVAPLLELVDGGISLESSVAADKVVGRAAAFLYVLLKVDSVYADVISVPAERVLIEYGIDYSFGNRVGGIVNRAGDGACPMESAVMDVYDPDEALGKIREALEMLKIKQNNT